MAKFKYNSRKFLNKKSGLAAIESSLESWEYGHGIDCTVAISDCHRSVSLDFGVYGLDDLAVKYQKLTLLQTEINKLHEYLTDNYDEIAADIKAKQEKAKAERKKRKSKVVSVVDELQ